MFKQDRSNLLEDIQKGIQLKSSKHLSIDRSSPHVKGDSLSRGINNIHLSSTSLKPTNGFQKVEASRNGPFQNKPGKTNPPLPPRPSMSTSNISGQKPPILPPKPKFSASTSAQDLLRNNAPPRPAPSDLKGQVARVTSVDGRAAESKTVKSTVEYFATMKRSQGKNLSQQNGEIPVDRPRSGSFHQNRLVISSLFGDGGSASHVASDDKSPSVGRREDFDAIDRFRHPTFDEGSRTHKPQRRMTAAEVDSACLNVHNRPTSRSMANNNSSRSNSSSNNNTHVPSSRSSRPLPPLPSKAPPNRQEREHHVRRTKIRKDGGFEDRFTFHGEEDFPKPPPFRRKKKSSASSSSSNSIYWSHQDIKGIPLVTTV